MGETHPFTDPPPRDPQALWSAMPERVRTVVRQVARWHGVTPAAILADGRRRDVTPARFEAWHLLRTIPAPNGRVPSLIAIGDWFGRDHTSVISGLRRYEATRCCHDVVAAIYQGAG